MRFFGVSTEIVLPHYSLLSVLIFAYPVQKLSSSRCNKISSYFAFYNYGALNINAFITEILCARLSNLRINFLGSDITQQKLKDLLTAFLMAKQLLSYLYDKTCPLHVPLPPFPAFGLHLSYSVWCRADFQIHRCQTISTNSQPAMTILPGNDRFLPCTHDICYVCCS